MPSRKFRKSQLIKIQCIKIKIIEMEITEVPTEGIQSKILTQIRKYRIPISKK
jgi:hypothetical protein